MVLCAYRAQAQDAHSLTVNKKNGTSISELPYSEFCLYMNTSHVVFNCSVLHIILQGFNKSKEGEEGHKMGNKIP
jgi:hypothetical protein